MRNTLTLILAALLLISLPGCDSTAAEPEQVITMAADAPVEDSGSRAAAEGYCFPVNGVTLVPGTPFDPAAPGEALSVFEAPSCAIEGTDIVYSYEGFEITAVDDGSGQILYSIYLLDSSLSTAEGLSIGDSEETAEALYGSSWDVSEGVCTCTAGNTRLILILSDGTVSSIEYRIAA